MEYPKIIAVKPLKNYRLRVSFRNGGQKVYDCSALLEKPVFQPLKDKAFFRAVWVDQGGYGVSWSEEVDLAEAELWVNGVEVEGEGVMSGLAASGEKEDGAVAMRSARREARW